MLPKPEKTDLPAVLPTEQAAPFINRRPYTLRRWACYGNGPIQPLRINGRLAWRVSDLLALLNGEPIPTAPPRPAKPSRHQKQEVASHD